METNAPRYDAKIRIAVFFVLTTAAFGLSASTEEGHWAGGLFLAGTLALFHGLGATNSGKRTTSARVTGTIFYVSYFAILGYWCWPGGAPTPPSIAVALCLMTLVICVRKWRHVNSADEAALRSTF